MMHATLGVEVPSHLVVDAAAELRRLWDAQQQGLEPDIDVSLMLELEQAVREQECGSEIVGTPEQLAQLEAEVAACRAECRPTVGRQLLDEQVARPSWFQRVARFLGGFRR
jgi:hypothetical protein